MSHPFTEATLNRCGKNASDNVNNMKSKCAVPTEEKRKSIQKTPRRRQQTRRRERNIQEAGEEIRTWVDLKQVLYHVLTGNLQLVLIPEASRSL